MQKSTGCFYFGVPGRCGTLTGMQAAIGSFALLDLLSNFLHAYLQFYGESSTRFDLPSQLPQLGLHCEAVIPYFSVQGYCVPSYDQPIK